MTKIRSFEKSYGFFMNDVHPKSWTKNLTFGVHFMGKHYKYEFKLQVVQEYLNSSLGYKALTKKYFMEKVLTIFINLSKLFKII